MAGGAPTAAAVRRRTNGSPAAKDGNGATNGIHKNGHSEAPRRRGLVIAGVATAAILLRGLNTPGAAIYGKNNKAAGTRVRKGMQALKALAQDIRVEVQARKSDG